MSRAECAARLRQAEEKFVHVDFGLTRNELGDQVGSGPS